MSDRKLAARERLKSRKEIERVFSEGIRCGSGTLRAAAVPNERGYSRLGVGVSGKVCNAVKRNRLKRITREAFRLNKDAIPKGFDIFITHSRSDATFDEVQTHLVKIARQVQAGGRGC